MAIFIFSMNFCHRNKIISTFPRITPEMKMEAALVGHLFSDMMEMEHFEWLNCIPVKPLTKVNYHVDNIHVICEHTVIALSSPGANLIQERHISIKRYLRMNADTFQ